eukprot:TRINITY_DN2211_c0_g2_i1.p1 TRINITY_DN2211_c0_g2~~TRINITY_DN2211_c0_g2_i1.p1  ORF type:complete len:617 (+),score=167.08 TRINITY_DN2211_c0_g2_i1:91-1941(+)
MESFLLAIDDEIEHPNIEEVKEGEKSWAGRRIERIDREKFDLYFEKAKRSDGYVHGDLGMKVLERSKLPGSDLIKIWSLSDVDRDGKLSQAEFVLALYLIKCRLEGESLPNRVPMSLLDNDDSDSDDDSYKSEKVKDDTPPKAYRLVILGGQYGKTAYLYRFHSNMFEEHDCTPTLEYTYHHTCFIDGEETKIEILDTTGDDTYEHLRGNWYQRGEGYILLFDITNNRSIQEIQSFHLELVKARGSEVPAILVGTRSDLREKRVISIGKAIRMAAKMSCRYIEVSSKTGENVQESIKQLIWDIEEYKATKISRQREENLRKLGVKLDSSWMSRKFRRIEWRDEENKSDPLGTPLLDIPRGWHVEIACKSQGNLASPPDMVIEPKFTPYLTHLRKLPHSHYLAGTEEDPVVITVEEIESGAEKKPQRTIIRTKEHDVLVLMPTGVDRKPIYQQLVTSSIGNIKQASSPLLNDQLVLFEETNEYVCFKMGILYCKTNQNTELEMLTNSEPSVHCQEFLDMLGTTVNLEEHQGYRGGLDAHRDGKFSLFTQYEDIEIMWHVSTMLTHNPADPKHVTKKRHIGNDVVNVIFRDPPVDGVPHRPLNPNIIRSQLTRMTLSS